MEEIKIISDGFKIYGPKVDGGYTLTFSIGEYEKDKIAELIRENDNDNVYEVVIKERKYDK